MLAGQTVRAIRDIIVSPNAPMQYASGRFLFPRAKASGQAAPPQAKPSSYARARFPADIAYPAVTARFFVRYVKFKPIYSVLIHKFGDSILTNMVYYGLIEL